MEYPIRINKYLAHKGIATRRAADTLIESGKVFVNDTLATIGQQITKEDTVEVRGLERRNFRYLLYFKPRGIITHSPAEHETDILMKLKKDHGITDVFPVGRLDKDSEGLILLTDDGRVTERLLSPEKNHEKEYQVTVDKKVTGSFLQKLEAVVDIEGYVTKPATATRLSGDTSFSIILTEGKKHQVRRMCAALGYQVQKLTRARIMNLELHTLRPGNYRKISVPERKEFLKLLGLK